VGFATPNYLIQEMVRKDVSWRNDVISQPLLIESGVCAPPHLPGLGIEVNEKEARKHPYQREIIMARFHRDGSVADW
jgi:galactonate dehydratase